MVHVASSRIGHYVESITNVSTSLSRGFINASSADRDGGAVKLNVRNMVSMKGFADHESKMVSIFLEKPVSAQYPKL